MADLPVVRVRLPPHSPELNPAERVLEELRRHVEGRPCVTLAEQHAVAEAYLAALAADPARVRRLCGWVWLSAVLDPLPTA